MNNQQTRYRTYAGSSSGSRTTIYTCPPNSRAIVRSINVEESSGSGVLATLELYDSSSTTYYTLINDRGCPIAYGEHVFILEAGDQICVTASSGTSPVTDCVVSVEELFITELGY